MNGTRGSSFLDPDLVVMHPDNWSVTRLLTDEQGQFFGGGPWGGAYGNAGQASSSRFTAAPLWNVPVYVSTVLGSGTALVGNFREAAHIWRRGGVTVEASNSHEDFFIRNLNMLRAEERLALGVYRPVAFTVVTGLD